MRSNSPEINNINNNSIIPSSITIKNGLLPTSLEPSIYQNMTNTQKHKYFYKSPEVRKKTANVGQSRNAGKGVEITQFATDSEGQPNLNVVKMNEKHRKYANGGKFVTDQFKPISFSKNSQKNSNHQSTSLSRLFNQFGSLNQMINNNVSSFSNPKSQYNDYTRPETMMTHYLRNGTAGGGASSFLQRNQLCSPNAQLPQKDEFDQTSPKIQEQKANYQYYSEQGNSSIIDIHDQVVPQRKALPFQKSEKFSRHLQRKMRKPLNDSIISQQQYQQIAQQIQPVEIFSQLDYNRGRQTCIGGNRSDLSGESDNSPLMKLEGNLSINSYYDSLNGLGVNTGVLKKRKKKNGGLDRVIDTKKGAAGNQTFSLVRELEKRRTMQKFNQLRDSQALRHGILPQIQKEKKVKTSVGNQQVPLNQQQQFQIQQLQQQQQLQLQQQKQLQLQSQFYIQSPHNNNLQNGENKSQNSSIFLSNNQSQMFTQESSNMSNALTINPKNPQILNHLQSQQQTINIIENENPQQRSSIQQLQQQTQQTEQQMLLAKVMNRTMKINQKMHAGVGMKGISLQNNPYINNKQ